MTVKRITLLGLGAIALTATLTIAIPPAVANCLDPVGQDEFWQPPLQRHWQQLQQRMEYPWGKARPYGQLSKDRITFAAAFDQLTGAQKQQVLSLLLNP